MSPRAPKSREVVIMGRSTWKFALEALSWVGILFMTAFVAAVGYFAWAQSGGAAHRKTVTLEMSWKRGDTHYGPNFIHLESACLSNPEPGCFCSKDFTSTRTKEFGDYIESFGNKKVPVKYRVDYDGNGQPGGAALESVGAWPVERFNIVERRMPLSSGSRMQPGGGVSHLRTPGDCFPTEK
jgi:hypothetical protein